MDTMAAIRQTFFQECEEQLAELESGLLAIEQQESDSETINAVFRAVHSIKGGAGAFGLDELVRFAHTFETTLDLMRSNALEISSSLIKLMLRAADGLADLVRFSRDGTDLDRARISQLNGELTRAASGDAAPSAAQTEGTAPDAAAEPEPGPDENGFTPIRFSLEDLVGSGLDSPFGDDASAPLQVTFRPKPELYAKANDAVVLLRELRRLGEARIACDISAVPLLTELDPEGSYLSWTIELDPSIEESAVREVFEFVTFDCDLDIARKAPSDPDATESADFQVIPIADISALVAELPGPVAPVEAAAAPQPQREPTPTELLIKAGTAQAAAQSGQQTTIRVDLDRVDRLIDLVGELVINQSMLAQRVTEAGIARLSEVAVGLDDLEHLTREIQDSVMAIRAQPVRPIFQRMSRVVREVADMVGKSVRLVTEGENCEVDKTVIERLADPLTHMIRNAIDHGLEKPEDRLAAGKSEQGVVRMTAAHRSGRVIIEVSDDGGGINRARVRDIAITKGLIDPNAQLTDGEIDDLIFHPGFSTASTISDVSGRGVGMDVVKRSIQALGGRISITSRPGLGTTFTLSLPLTLAVLDGMVVTIAGQTLVVPLTAIVETLQPKRQDVHGLGETSQVIAIRGSFIPLIDIGLQLGYRDEEADPLNSVAILVESENRTQNALLVDGIIGQQQVVIKSLETNYGHVVGVAAATILGDGRVAVILDVDAIVAGTRSEMNRSDLSNRKRNAA
ncbi:chemotaxis protein CheA [Mesorhizobium sp. L-8-3]|uniref:chemotaxis protein CheA n=1 Tax=Mesorhizobium sp. L-8-3 TaxID=2744522 RepID=UPI001927D802|nr:chemotaxis protein CheA [Mesorhizobium sp. L-8-3]BCH23189.1 chemotaxis protein CheA [Mesorhizobium sp. L-8-3]